MAPNHYFSHTEKVSQARKNSILTMTYNVIYIQYCFPEMVLHSMNTANIQYFYIFCWFFAQVVWFCFTWVSPQSLLVHRPVGWPAVHSWGWTRCHGEGGPPRRRPALWYWMVVVLCSNVDYLYRSCLLSGYFLFQASRWLLEFVIYVKCSI